MKRNLAKVLAAVMLVGGMTVNVNAEYVKGGNLNLTEDDANNKNMAGETVADGEKTVGTGTVDVYVNTSGKREVQHVYAVSIDQKSLTYSYGTGKALIWNPVSMKYEFSASTGTTDWTEATKSIKVTNYSDMGIDIVGSYSFESTYNSAGISFSVTYDGEGEKLMLDSAWDGGAAAQAGEANATAKEGNVKLTISGTPNIEINNAKVGTLTLTVTKATV